MIQARPDSELSAQILEKVSRAIETLIETGAKYEGLIPSLLDLETNRMVEKLPPAIQGQRDWDRSHPGSNLIHDQPLLRTMYALGYEEAADRYLKRFATHCTGTVSGLFPWGEHSFWNLREDRVGDGHELTALRQSHGPVHDHLRQVPLWLWEKLHEFNPECVERFAEGLNNHWKAGEPLEYNRHASIDRIINQEKGESACDFPRHGGFYILDWTFAYMKTGRDDFLRQVKIMLDYWWEKKFPSNLLPLESRSSAKRAAFRLPDIPQTMSLGVSLLEASKLVEEIEPGIAATMYERGLVYVNAALEVDEPRAVWGSEYGSGGLLLPVMGLLAACAWRHSGDSAHLNYAVKVGETCLNEPYPEGGLISVCRDRNDRNFEERDWDHGKAAPKQIPAADAGLALGMLADLYAITGKRRWLQGGLKLADTFLEIYFDHDLPRGAAGIDWYESQMGPAFLLHGLARIALLEKNRETCPLEADYTMR